jgi:phytoene dehydrogenase-like protein
LLPFPSIRPALRLGIVNMLRAARVFLSSGAGLSRRLFETSAAQRVLPSLAMHVDIGPEDAFGAALAYVLGLTATTGGYAVPRGGAQALTDAMVRLLESHGGRVRLGARVDRVIVSSGRAVGARLSNGDEIRASRGILADTGAPSLLLDLVERGSVPGRVVRKMQRFVYGWGTFKVDWALSGPVPWTVEPARQSAVVHAGDSLDDLVRFTNEVRGGALPQRPYLVMGQQSLIDPSRAPEGQHTLYCYTRVPSQVDGGWGARREAFADTVEERIEELAPGFRALVLGRRIASPADLEAMDANLVGGDLGGGSNAWNRLLLFRPVFPYFRYRMPVKGLYLCSSYAHPGAGVHGMCGFNAANMAARDLGA